MTEPLTERPEHPASQAPHVPPLAAAAPLAPADRDVLTLALRAMHPAAIPELIAGDTVADILASVETAREAYARARFHSAAPAAN